MAREKVSTREIKLGEKKDNSEALIYLKVEEEVTIRPTDEFVILPGPKGEGWKLKVRSPVEANATS